MKTKRIALYMGGGEIALLIFSMCLKWRVSPIHLPEKIDNWWQHEKFRRFGGVYNVTLEDTLNLIPTLYISTDNPIELEKRYIDAKLRVVSKGAKDDETFVCKVRPRGNTTLLLDKTPFNIKFDHKVSLCGFSNAKRYVLLANYHDTSLLRNAVTFKMAELLGMPFTNHTVPVNVVVNGNYRGVYDLTEKIDINKASVNIDKKCELLLELDDHTDMPDSFISSVYGLKVRVKEGAYTLPEAQSLFTQIENLIADIEPDDEQTASIAFERIDLDSFVKYTLVNLLSSNHEFLWPKSVFVYTSEHGNVFHFGPIWDYDLGYNAEHLSVNVLDDMDSLVRLDFITSEHDSFRQNAKMMALFLRLVKTPQFRRHFCECWQQFRDESFEDLLAFFDDYASLINQYQKYMVKAYPYQRTFPLRKSPTDLSPIHNELRQWILLQADAIDKLAAHLLELETASRQ